MVIAADAAAALTTNEALYTSPRHLVLPLGAGLWVAVRASVVSQLVAVQPPQRSYSQRSSSTNHQRGPCTTSPRHLILPLGAGLWVAVRASVVSQLVAVPQPQCSSSDRSKASSGLAVVPYQSSPGRTDLDEGVLTAGSAQ